MTSQLPIFTEVDATPKPAPVARVDKRSGEQRKRDGMRSAAAEHADDIGYARCLAFDIVSAKALRGLKPTITMDEVAVALEAEGKPPLLNAAGMVFQCNPWKWTGELVKSVRPQSHQNLLRVWLYDAPISQ